MTLAEYRRRYGDKTPKVKGKPTRRSEDAKHLFADAWGKHAPANAPRLMPEYRFCPDRKFRADYKISRHRLLIEIDGGTFKANGGRHNTDEDRHKGNLAAALGFRVMHFSPHTLRRDPVGCVELVLKAIGYKVKQ